MSEYGVSPAHVALRVGEVSGRVYIDLGGPSWEVVEVSADGWMIKQAAAVPIRFRRSKTTRPLPAPVRGGSLDELRPFISYEAEEDWRLILTYLLFCLPPCPRSEGTDRSVSDDQLRVAD